MSDNFKYFRQEDAEKFSYYSIPKELFTNSRYNKISTDAKLLYGILRDRNSLSIKNNWVDDNGNIYIFFTREEVIEIFGFSDKTVTKIFKELKDVDLISEKRQGLGKANIIYVGQIVAESIDTPKNGKNYDSEKGKNPSQNAENLRGNNLKDNNLKNNNKVSQSNETDGPTDESINDLTVVEKIIDNSEVYLYESRIFIEQVITKLYTDRKIAYTLKMRLTHDVIRERLKLLQQRHVDRALDKFRQAKTVTNKEIYFAKCLLTAIVEIDLDFQEEYTGME